MTKAPRRHKKNAGKKARRPKPRPRKKPFTTPAEARRRAANHVAARLFQDAQVRDGAGVRLGIFLPDKLTANDVWVVYKNSKSLGLESPDVVLVCKRTGRIMYEGSAFDEG